MKYTNTLPLINESLLEATGDEWINAIEGNEAEIIKRCTLYPELADILDEVLSSLNGCEYALPGYLPEDIDRLLKKIKET